MIMHATQVENKTRKKCKLEQNTAVLDLNINSDISDIEKEIEEDGYEDDEERVPKTPATA